MDANTWTEVINEGGEGYNPFTTPEGDEPAWSRVESMWAKAQRIGNGMSNSHPDYAKQIVKRDALKIAYKQLMVEAGI